MLAEDLTNILFHSAFACYVKNRDGRYLYINETGGRMLGLTPVDVIGKDDSALFTKEGFQTIAKEDAMTYYSSQPVTYISQARASGLGAHPNFRAIKTRLESSKSARPDALLGVAIYDNPENPIQPDMIRIMHQILKRAGDFETAIRNIDGSRFLRF